MSPRAARIAGQLLQGLVLGLLVAAAVVEMLILASGATVFRYQGF